MTVNKQNLSAPDDSGSNGLLPLVPHTPETLQRLSTDELNELADNVADERNQRHKRLIAEAERIKPKRTRGPNKAKGVSNIAIGNSLHAALEADIAAGGTGED